MLISVVGNAQSLLNKQDGSIIDQGDMIIRFNKGIITHPRCQGSRTTTYVCSLDDSSKTKFGNVEHWCVKHGTSFDTEREYLQDAMLCKPSSGAIVLQRLKNDYSENEVQLFGFDWKATPTWCHPKWKQRGDPVKYPKGTHNWDKEKQYCLRLIEQMGWKLY